MPLRHFHPRTRGRRDVWFVPADGICCAVVSIFSLSTVVKPKKHLRNASHVCCHRRHRHRRHKSISTKYTHALLSLKCVLCCIRAYSIFITNARNAILFIYHENIMYFRCACAFALCAPNVGVRKLISNIYRGGTVRALHVCEFYNFFPQNMLQKKKKIRVSAYARGKFKLLLK